MSLILLRNHLLTFRFVLGCILVQRKFIGIGIRTTLVIAGVVVATGGAAGPIIAGAAIGAGSSAVISGVVTAKHGGSIADVAKSASNGFMWGAIGGSVGGVTSSAAAPAITKAFGTGLKSTLATGGLTGAVGGGLTGGVTSGLSGNDAKTVLKDTLKSAAAGAAIGVASAGIGYGIKSLRSGGTTEATGSGGEAGKSGSGSKPYTNSRPSYGKNQVNEVWENAKDPITGKVYDPSGVEITWDKTKSRNGQWDMGHIPGEKYSEMHQLYMDDVISKDEFLEWYRNPKNYRPELPSTNRSHKYE